MIDIETDVFSSVATPVRAEFGDIFVTGEYVAMPPHFPCMSIVEMNNSVYRPGRSSDAMENFAVVMYEINVYSNKVNVKKDECKRIIAAADVIMLQLGFERTMMQPIPNMNDATIYRMTARYEAVVSKDKTIYWR